MIYDFDHPPERRSSDSTKWREYPADVLPMWVADMDFQSPEPVIQAMHERLEHGVFGYPHEPATLKEVLVDRYADLFDWQFDPEAIIFLPGVIPGLNLACQLMAEAGGNVLVQTPVYRPILSAPKNAGLSRHDTQLLHLPDGSYAVDWEGFEAAIDQETRLFMLCNPHNPVGRVYRQDELLKMAEICLRHKVVICADEIHCDLIFRAHHHTPIASLDPEIAQQTITLLAPSKTYNLAGLKCAAAIIPNPELRQRFCQAAYGIIGGVNILGYTAALAAYSHGQEWLEQLLVYLEGNRDWLGEYVGENLPEVNMAKPEGTYLTWLDCRALQLSPSPYRFFLEHARVALIDGKVFGTGGEGFVRLNFGCSRQLLRDALGRMTEAVRVAQPD